MIGFLGDWVLGFLKMTQFPVTEATLLVASIAVTILLELLEKCYPTQMKSRPWQEKLKEMIPTHGQSLMKHDGLCRQVRTRTGRC